MNKFQSASLQAILLTTALGLFGCDGGTKATNANEPSAAAVVPAQAAEIITVDKPWIRATPPGQSVSGAFMTLVNDSATAHTLSSVSFSAASAVEIHETSMKDGMMRMRQVGHIDIPANGSAELKPGSFHIMLIGLERDMKAGGVESLTLTFSDGSQKTVAARVAASGE
jgi:copper(I)-binding protein